MKAEDINLTLNEIRNSLTSYCVNECKSKCCKFGKLLLQNKHEVESIVSSNKKFSSKKYLEKQTNGFYHFDLEKNKSCPNLSSEGLCGIYTNPNRPRVCSDYPLFKVGDFIITASSCRAIENNVLDKELEKVKEMGFKVV